MKRAEGQILVLAETRGEYGVRPSDLRGRTEERAIDALADARWVRWDQAGMRWTVTAEGAAAARILEIG